jgi:hypothetical protein
LARAAGGGCGAPAALRAGTGQRGARGGRWHGRWPAARPGGVRVTRSLFYPRCRAQLEVVFDGRGAANSKPFMLEVDPVEANVGLNGFYEADTWSVDFDARLLPFDPDQLAYCAARIYMWDSQKNLEEADWAIDKNLMIRGVLDDAETQIVGDDNVVKLTGRDYLGLLADTAWDPRDRIPGGQTLVDQVQEIADAAAPKGTRARFQVVWQGEHDPPIVGELHRSSKKKGFHVKEGKNYWDVIWDLCIAHAYVPRVDGTQIIIAEPSTQTKASLEEAPRLIYGQTLTELSIQRKFTRETVPQIVIVAYDPVTGKKIEVKYPEKRNITVQATANRDQARDALGIPLTVKKDEVQYFPAPRGVTDPDALKRYARMQFYRIGRGETTYTMKTSHLLIDDAKTPGVEVNVLGLRPGNAIGVQFDPFNRETPTLRTLAVGQRVEHIEALGYNHEIATFVANNLDRMDLFNQNYYHNRGTLEYSTDEGISIEVEAVNFASEVREVHFAEAAA